MFLTTLKAWQVVYNVDSALAFNLGVQKMRSSMFQAWLFAFATGLFGSFKGASADAADRYLFGVVPEQSAINLSKNWLPLVSLLSQRTGINLYFVTAKDIPTFERCLSLGVYDFAFMDPYHYTIFHESPGYVGFARQGDGLSRGILVTHAANMIQDLKDLENTKLAFPAPSSFGATILPMAEMARRGVSFHAEYVRSHASVYRAVASGLYAAGGGDVRTFENAPASVRKNLRIIFETDNYTLNAFAAHPRVSAELIKSLSKILTSLPEGSAILERLGIDFIVEAKNNDWEDIRKLSLTAAEKRASDSEANCNFTHLRL